MQIKSIILYNKQGARRIVSFEIGKVNIITGESKTGKTAIIDIVNYCLGSDDCRVSEGVIRQTVDWFGILLKYENEEIFVARRNPNSLGQASTQYIYFANADSIKIPELSELKNNSDIATLKDFFTKKLFISEFTNTPAVATRDSLAVNFKHSRFYSYQPQDLIAQRNFLFFNQSEPFIPQAIKDTLPYFLGAIREDTIKIEQEIAIKKRELLKYERELREYERIKVDGSQKVFELVNEAKQLDLLPAEMLSENETQALNSLKIVLDWEQTESEIAQGENENLKKLIDEKTAFERELGRKKDDLAAVTNFIDQTSEYSIEITQQKARLESIGLFGETEAELHSCPLCSQSIETEIPSISAINRSLSDLSENLTHTIAERPKLGEYVQRLNLEKDSLKKQIEDRQRGIRAIYAEQAEAGKQKDSNIRKGKALGKISLFLESFRTIEEDKTIQDKIKLLATEISELELMVGAEEKDERLNSILNQINNQMTNWSKNLDLEHQDAPIRFDIRKLTIFADTPTKSIPLNQMGSGANWVAYHLLIHFALHKHFVKAERPVPRFLILDQPSQAYYPPDRDNELRGNLSTSSDETAVKQLYDFIFSVTRELAPHFQLIITDHARLNYAEFSECITEEWRNGTKLIPTDWFLQ
ncbi:DUF3732 domain-containing protein [Dyadobacter crusticola]|uniref:DUF3732 domain-containing protein n=1 Tax=Dyadobacter crusticola TaxID=292407 RepID=UPI0004E23BB5|nr:DUF3732 domain-containing protein [Dyadobacter crusticola]